MASVNNRILLLEDKLGVTANYRSIWGTLCFQAGINANDIRHLNLYRDMRRVKWLIKYRNRKAPTWNPNVAEVYRNAVETAIERFNPALVITACPASLSMLGVAVEFATLDNLRGGVYTPFKNPKLKLLVTLPISAWHRSVKEKDLAQTNKGFTDQAEFIDNEVYLAQAGDEALGHEDDDPETDYEEIVAEAEDLWYEPVVVPYGRFVLAADMQKAGRLLRSR